MQLFFFKCVYFIMEAVDSENKLVENILKGNSDEFRTLVNKYKRLVYHIVFRLVKSNEDQEELGQEIFLKVFQNLSTFQHKSKLSTWIARIAYNTSLNYLRKKKIPLYDDELSSEKRKMNASSSFNIGIHAVTSDTELPDETLQKDQISNFLQEEINKLPIQYRQIISFYHLENLSQQEIAEVMNLPIGTVKSYIYRARKLMKDRLLAKYKREDLCL